MQNWSMLKSEDKSIVQLNPILRYALIDYFFRYSLTHSFIHLRPMGKTGSRVSRSLRAEGIIPGVLYGSDHQGNVMKLVIGIDKKILMKEMRLRNMSFENTLYEMNVNGTKYMVTPRQLQVNPMTDEPLGNTIHSFTYFLTHSFLNIRLQFSPLQTWQ